MTRGEVLEIKKYDFIDALRGWAIILVLLAHCGAFGSNYYPEFMQKALSKCGIGVELFYMVSAYTLFLSYTSRKGKERGVTRNFFLRRFFRVWPMYLLTVLVFLLVGGLGARDWLGDQEKVTNANIVFNGLMLHGFNPYYINSIVPVGWSVAIEVQFYLLLPLLFYWIKTLRAAIMFLIFSLVLQLVLSYVFTRFIPISDTKLWFDYLNYYLFQHLSVFALGIFCYFLFNGGEGGVNYGWLMFFILAIIFGYMSELYVFPSVFILSMFLTVFIWILKQRPLRIFVNKATIFIGKISYSIYLVHFLVLKLMVSWGFIDFLIPSRYLTGVMNFGIRLLVYGIISIAISSVTYYLVEKKMMALGKKLIYFLESRLIPN